MRLYLNFILTVIAICLIVIMFKICKIPSEAYAYGDSPVPVEIVDVKMDYSFHFLPVKIIDKEKPLPVEIISIKKPDPHPSPSNVEEFYKIKSFKWDKILVDAK